MTRFMLGLALGASLVCSSAAFAEGGGGSGGKGGGSGNNPNGYQNICRNIVRAKICPTGTCPPGTSAMRNAQIQRCMQNNGRL